MLGGFCLSDGITLLMGLEYVGWSLFVRWNNRLKRKDHPAYSSATSTVILSDRQRPPNKRDTSNSAETVMQFTDEHVNKRLIEISLCGLNAY
jgi:hypothetical protein